MTLNASVSLAPELTAPVQFITLTSRVVYLPIFLLPEQQFFEKVKQLSQSQEDYLSQNQEHLQLKEEFKEQGTNWTYCCSACAFNVDYFTMCITFKSPFFY